MSDQADALWAAVDGLTKPTRRKTERDFDAAEWLDELADVGQGSFCRISDYRAAVLAYGEIPALWDQAEWSLTPAMETRFDGDGGAGCTRERSPADLNLMETMLQVREGIAAEFKARGLAPRDGVKAQIRQLASHLAKDSAETVGWWTYRLNQWARVLEQQLDMLEHEARPVHLRNTTCPQCGTRQVVLRDDKTGERKIWPAIKIDFVDGTIRAAYCLHCGSAWFRGSDLYVLKDATDPEALSA